jgi:hypothetical protein
VARRHLAAELVEQIELGDSWDNSWLLTLNSPMWADRRSE